MAFRSQVFEEEVYPLSSFAISEDRLGAEGFLRLAKSNNLTSFIILYEKDGHNEIVRFNSRTLVNSKNEINFEKYISNYKNKPLKLKDTSIKLNEFDFLSIDLKSGRVLARVDGFDSNGAYVLLNNKIAYYKVPLDVINSSSFDSGHKSVFGKVSQKSDMALSFSHVTEVSNLLSKLKACSSKKDQKCITDLFTKSSETEYSQNKVRENFIRRFIFDDPKTCEIYKKSRSSEFENDTHIPTNIDQVVDYNKSNVWSSLEAVTNLDLNNIYAKFESNNIYQGYNVITLVKKMKLPLSCSNNRDVFISFVKLNNKWLISSFFLTSEDDN